MLSPFAAPCLAAENFALPLSCQETNWADLRHWACNDNVHPSREGTYDGISLHPFETVSRYHTCASCDAGGRSALPHGPFTASHWAAHALPASVHPFPVAATLLADVRRAA